MNRRDFLKAAFIFTGALWVPKTGILRSDGAEARLPLGAGNTFKSRVYSGVTLKMSTVTGGAFLDLISGSIPFGLYLNRKITVSDGVNSVVGYIKSVGTARTLGSELITNGSFDTLTGWSIGRGTGVSIAGGQSGNCLELTSNGTANGPYTSWPTILPNGALLQLSCYVKQGTGGNVPGYIMAQSGYLIVRTPSTSWEQMTGYQTTPQANSSIFLIFPTLATSGLTGLFDTVSARQVLAPGASGIIVTSTRGGSVQSWTSNTGINPNATVFTVMISQ